MNISCQMCRIVVAQYHVRPTPAQWKISCLIENTSSTDGFSICQAIFGCFSGGGLLYRCFWLPWINSDVQFFLDCDFTLPLSQMTKGAPSKVFTAFAKKNHGCIWITLQETDITLTSPHFWVVFRPVSQGGICDRFLEEHWALWRSNVIELLCCTWIDWIWL